MGMMFKTTLTASARVLLGVVLGMALAPVSARAQTEDVVYYHTDAIGSVRAITDATGASSVATTICRLASCGRVCLAARRTPTVRGKERDDETGLDYFGARYHYGVIGRFTTVDPVLNVEAAMTDPQRWSRYAYAKNNPFVFIDPDGRDAIFGQVAPRRPVHANCLADPGQGF